MRNLILLATGTSHELYVYMIDQRGHLQKKRSGRWKGGRERDGRGMGEGWERFGRGSGEGWEGVGKDISGQASFCCGCFRVHLESLAEGK